MSEYKGVVRFKHPWQGVSETMAYVVLPKSAASEFHDGEEVVVIRDDRFTMTDAGRAALEKTK